MTMTSEQLAHGARLIIPIIMGLAAFVLGLLNGNMGVMAFGAGLIGAPSVLRVVGGTPTPPPAAPAPAPAAVSE
jgi:hypothetical protein